VFHIIALPSLAFGTLAKYHPYSMPESSTPHDQTALSAPPPAAPRGLADAATRWGMVVMGFLALAAAVATYLFFDQRLMWSARTLGTFWQEIAQYVTELGSGTAYLIGLPVLALIMRLINQQRAMAWAMLAWVTSASCLSVQLLKIIFGRFRPSLLESSGLYGFGWFKVGYNHASFPSGHAMTAAALCTVLWLIWPRRWPLWLILGIVVSSTRIFTTSHYLAMSSSADTSAFSSRC
jgi:membrane-associated phospholipid phosphatase